MALAETYLDVWHSLPSWQIIRGGARESRRTAFDELDLVQWADPLLRGS
jgi:hypothetical protein